MINKSSVWQLLANTLMVCALSACALKKPDLNKEQAATFHHMGNFTSKHADYNRAADMYKKAYKLDPSKSKSLVSLAKVQIMMGKYDEAITTYHKVLRQDKNSKPARQGLAVAYFTAGESLDAAEQWQLLLNQEPKNTEALNGLGLVMEQIHNYPRAQSCFKLALKTTPESPLLLNNLGLTLALQGALSQGIAQLRTAQKITPSERLKNNLNLLQAIANKEASLEVLMSKLDAGFPKQRTSLTAEHKQTLTKYVNKWCPSTV